MSKSHLAWKILAAGGGLAMLCFGIPAVAASGSNVTPPVMGTAANFAVIAGSTITTVPPMQINGNLALSPGSAVTGGPTVTGTSDIDNSVAVQAQKDLTTAYTDAMDATPADNLTTAGGTTELGGQVLTPGVYSITNAALLDGVLTLNGEGQTNPTFIFQFSSSITTGSGSSVVLENGAGSCAVYWQVVSDAILGSGSSFQGNLMTQSGITMGVGSNIGLGGGNKGGRALVSTSGALTADGNNSITPPSASCVYTAATPSPSPTPTATPTSTVTPKPTPTTTPTPTPVKFPKTGVVSSGGNWDGWLLILAICLMLGGTGLFVKKSFKTSSNKKR